MDQYFRDAMEGIKQAAEGLQAANKGIAIATEGIKKTADAMLTAHSEHDELGLTVARLETELLKLSAEFREYRNGRH